MPWDIMKSQILEVIFSRGWLFEISKTYRKHFHKISEIPIALLVSEKRFPSPIQVPRNYGGPTGPLRPAWIFQGWTHQ